MCKSKVDGTCYCFAEFSMRLHIKSNELCYPGTLSSMPQAPQQPFVPDSQGAHYVQGLVLFFTVLHSGKRESMGTMVRR